MKSAAVAREGRWVVTRRPSCVSARLGNHHISDPKILVLDEATSSVDTETEYLVQDALRKFMAKRTSIVVAHRLSTIRYVDRIIVLHKGRVIEEGTHAELLAKSGHYARLYELQFKDQERTHCRSNFRPARASISVQRFQMAGGVGEGVRAARRQPKRCAGRQIGWK